VALGTVMIVEGFTIILFASGIDRLKYVIAEENGRNLVFLFYN
jgi:hypothetical protein